MKKTLKIGGILFIVAVLIAVIIGVRLYNKPAKTVDAEEGIKVSAVELANYYEKNENVKPNKYTDKAVQIRGVITDLRTNQQNKTVITFSGTDMSGVQCSLMSAEPSLKKGDSITVKGFCTGYLTDVIVDRGILVK
jgi:hypothetical protein